MSVRWRRGMIRAESPSALLRGMIRAESPSALLRSFVAMLALAACGGAQGGSSGPADTLRSNVEVATFPSGVRGARLVPESVDLERSFGVEPGGGLRGIAAGVRVVSYASGAVLTAPDRLAQAPSSTTVLPDRLGGGVLFAIGDTLWRAEKWLARATPIFKAPGAIKAVWIGLDRVVLRMPSNALVAVDPVSGAPLDLGAMPPSPAITALGAIDGFRAVALADLRGVIATTDAGATWRTVPIPAEPRELIVSGDSLTVLGVNGSEGLAFEVRPEGDFSRVSRPSAEKGTNADMVARSASAAASAPARNFEAESARLFGQRPLALAVSDGITLADGSALVAHSGALARVRLADGAILDLARDVFPLRSARCHGIAVGDANGAGFVCGEPQGRTHVYRYVPARRGLELVMGFDLPRVVLSGGNGAIAVRGRCAEDAPSPTAVPGGPPADVTYCVRAVGGALREQKIVGAHVEQARVVPLRDGRLAVIVAPRGELGGGHVTIVDDNGPKTVPLVFDEPAETARRVVGQGMWLDGFEERSPGVFGGWIEHAGTVLGVEVKADGHAKHGAFVRDIGSSVFVSGRFGLAWIGAQRGFETTDGGFSWRGVELPDKLDAKGRETRAARGCSSAGCVLSGWIRVGWGENPAPPATPPQSIAAWRPTALPSLDLVCDLTVAARDRSAPPPARALGVSAVTQRIQPGGIMSASVTRVWRSGTSEFTPFAGVAPPARRADDVEAQYEVYAHSDSSRAMGALARVYVWGSKGLEWDATSRWLVRWLSPFASSADVHSTPASAPPRSVVDAARFAAGGPVRPFAAVTVALSDDPRHSLFMGSRASQNSGPSESIAVVLDDGRAPVEVRRADGEPFANIHAALRVEGRWFLATEPGPNEPLAAVLWEVDAGIARELARVPRVGVEGARAIAPLRLARREGESTIGIVVEGQPNADGKVARRYVLGVDATSGRVGEIEALGGADYDGRTLVPCGGDEGGWIVDLPLGSQPIRMTLAGRSPLSLRSGVGRVRFGRGKACVQQLSATYDKEEELPKSVVRPHPDRPVALGLMIGSSRQELRCKGLAP